MCNFDQKSNPIHFQLACKRQTGEEKTVKRHHSKEGKYLEIYSDHYSTQPKIPSCDISQ